MYYLKSYDAALLELERRLLADQDTSIDLIEGSVLLSLIEAVAFQIADLSERQERSVLEAIPDAVFQAFGFGLKAAAPAQGTLTFTTPVPAVDLIFVPAGSEGIAADDKIFATTQDAFIVPGASSVDVPAVALTAGSAGNIGALIVARLGTGLPGVQSVANLAPFTGGSDEESRDVRAARFAQYVASLDRSGRSGVRAAALSASAGDGDAVITLSDCLVHDCDNNANVPPCLLHVYGYRRGGVPPALQLAVRGAVMGARAGGVLAFTHWTTGTPVNVTVQVRVPDVSVRDRALASVRQAVSDYMASLTYGQSASYENLIALATAAHPAIEEVLMLTPTADYDAQATEHLELGTLTVTAGSA